MDHPAYLTNNFIDIGSQDCYWHNKNGKMNNSVLGYILQAPVSDRECGYKFEPTFGEQVELATKMRKEGNGGEFLPRKYWDSPMTADRLYSLGAYGLVHKAMLSCPF